MTTNKELCLINKDKDSSFKPYAVKDVDDVS